MEVKTANEQFEEWYPEAVAQLKAEYIDISSDAMMKHIANLAYVEGYYDGIKEVTKK